MVEVSLWLICFLVGGVKGILLRGPSDVVAVKGSDVTLPCYTDLGEPVEWARKKIHKGCTLDWDYIYQGDLKRHYRQKFHVNVDITRNQYNLTIKNISREDAGTYRCADLYGSRISDCQFLLAELIVTDDTLQCFKDNMSLYAVTNSSISLPGYGWQCSLRYTGKVVPHLQWSIGRDVMNTHSDVSVVDIKPSLNIYMIVSALLGAIIVVLLVNCIILAYKLKNIKTVSRSKGWTINEKSSNFNFRSSSSLAYLCKETEQLLPRDAVEEIDTLTEDILKQHRTNLNSFSLSSPSILKALYNLKYRIDVMLQMIKNEPKLRIGNTSLILDSVKSRLARANIFHATESIFTKINADNAEIAEGRFNIRNETDQLEPADYDRSTERSIIKLTDFLSQYYWHVIINVITLEEATEIFTKTMQVTEDKLYNVIHRLTRTEDNFSNNTRNSMNLSESLMMQLHTTNQQLRQQQVLLEKAKEDNLNLRKELQEKYEELSILKSNVHHRVGVVKTKVNSSITGITTIDDKVYVVNSGSSKVRVFNSENLEAFPSIKIAKMTEPRGIAGCSHNKVLYIVEFTGHQTTPEPSGKRKVRRYAEFPDLHWIHIVNTSVESDDKVKSLPLHLKFNLEPLGVSVTSDQNILLTVKKTDQENIDKKSEILLIRYCKLDLTSQNRPNHSERKLECSLKNAEEVLEISKGKYLVRCSSEEHCNTEESSETNISSMLYAGLCKIKYDAEMRQFIITQKAEEQARIEDPAKKPASIALDKNNGRIFVSYHESRLISILDSDFKLQKQFTIEPHSMAISRIHFDSNTGRLFAYATIPNEKSNDIDKSTVDVEGVLSESNSGISSHFTNSAKTNLNVGSDITETSKTKRISNNSDSSVNKSYLMYIKLDSV